MSLVSSLRPAVVKFTAHNFRLLTGSINNPIVQSRRTLKASPKKKSKDGKFRRAAANFDDLGSWNNRMDMPLNMEQSIRTGKLIPKISSQYVGVDTLTGRRKDNEDRFIFKDLANNLLMVGIFDGHGGSLAAEYTCLHMEDHIKFWLERGEKDLHKVLHHAFLEVHNSFAKYLYHNHIGQDAILQSGTTATVCLLRNSIELVVGHVGDTCALLCRDGDVMRLTTDHEPEHIGEKNRIEKAGGRIMWTSTGRPRVNGRLDMTRSIGDLDLKPYGVIPVPEVKSARIKHHRDAFLVLTTDGITFAVSDMEMMNCVSQCRTTKEAAKFLTDQALHFGSEDNVTALVVPFGSWGKYAGQASQKSSTFMRGMVGSRWNN